MIRLFAFLLLSAFASLQTTYNASAAVSPWSNVHGGAVRLISSGPGENGLYRIGVEFSMDPGWHTYWRFPGEAGIPPTFDFSGSQNLKSTAILFPVPERYDDGFSQSIVYKDAVVLPVDAAAADPSRPIEISLSLFFGICKDICVPGEAELTLTLAPSAEVDKTAAFLIDRDRALVPGAPVEGGPRVKDIRSEQAGQSHKLVITAEVSEGGAHDLFAEGPEGSYIALPVLAESSGSRAVWTLSTRGLARSGEGSRLTLVLKDNDTAVEETFELGPALLPPAAK
ncbi:protein-disulfide reductase DsbD domain-containing protein [Roseibium sp.]|uniref:protein-disulfide reductase DsbD domain-containing protein n=1 Tax=Roseibium sp. TaxID=1936156 RepID=UPI003A96929C